MFHSNVMFFQYVEDNKQVSIGITNSKAIKKGFEIGNITTADLLDSTPYRNSIDLITIKGKYIRQALQDSAGKLSADGKSLTSDGFLQVSGIKITIDLSRSNDDRITKLKVKCTQCSEVIYEDLIDDQNYNVSINSFLGIQGGDGYIVFPENKVSQLDGPLDTDVIKKYLEANSPISKDTIKDQNRITILGGTSGSARSIKSTNTLILETILYVVLVQCLCLSLVK